MSYKSTACRLMSPNRLPCVLEQHIFCQALSFTIDSRTQDAIGTGKMTMITSLQVSDLKYLFCSWMMLAPISYTCSATPC